MIRKINTNTIVKTIIQLCAKANWELRGDALVALKKAYKRENKPQAKRALDYIIKNAAIAKRERLAICQDTGLPVVFLEVGQNIHLVGGEVNKAIQKGIELGYKKASLRNSIIADPLNRGKPKFSPGIIHTEIVKGSKLRITVLPKGFGCENKSALKMFNPTASIDSIKKFIVETVKSAGSDACPPYVVGVGIGGSAEYAGLLAKKTLLRKIRNPKSEIRKKSQFSNSPISKLERDLLKQINKLGIGPMGMGGVNTALAVNIETYPTHIAGMPVAVNISCHALRSASKTI